eukprot:2373482-Amphidinium_carterae.1
MQGFPFKAVAEDPRVMGVKAVCQQMVGRRLVPLQQQFGSVAGFWGAEHLHNATYLRLVLHGSRKFVGSRRSGGLPFHFTFTCSYSNSSHIGEPSD